MYVFMRILLLIQVLEGTSSYNVSNSADVQHMSAPSFSLFKWADLGDEHSQRAGLGTVEAGICQMIM